MTVPLSTRLSTAERQSAQRLAITANVGTTTLASVTGGQLNSEVFQLYAAGVLGFSSGQVALVLVLLIVLVPLPLLVASRYRGQSKRGIMRWGYLGQVAGIVPLFFVPALLDANTLLGVGVLLVALLVIEASFLASWNVVWLPWMRDISAPTERGRLLGRMRRAVLLFEVAVLGLFGALVGDEVSEAAYAALLATLVAYLLVATALVSRIPDASDGTAGEDSPGAESLPWRQVLADPTVRNWLVVYCSAVVATIPLLPLYLRNVIGVPDRSIVLIVALQTFGIVCSLGPWGQLTDRLGARRVMASALFGLALAAPLWLTLPTGVGDRLDGSMLLIATLAVASAVLANGFAIAVLAGFATAVSDRLAVQGFTLLNSASTAARYSFVGASGLVLSVTADPLDGWLLRIDAFRMWILAGGCAAGAIGLFVLRGGLAGGPSVDEPEGSH